MKLHIVAGSPNSRKVLAVVQHLGLEIEYAHYDLFKGELMRPEYLALNPNARVPTLVDGSLVLWESNAITQYLADKADDAQLLPRAAQARADVLRWQFWEAVHFNQAFGTLAFETVAKPAHALETDDAQVTLATCNLTRTAPVLEQHLEGRQHLVGNTVTLADYSMIIFESYRSRVPFDWSRYPNINRYFDRMRKLDAWMQAQQPPVAIAA